MVGSLKTRTLVTLAGVVCSVWAVLLVNGGGAVGSRPLSPPSPPDLRDGAEPLSAAAMGNPSVPLPAIPNPLRGQYEDLLVPLFPQSNPAQKGYAPWPASDDASVRVSWRQLQPVDPRAVAADATDDRRFDFSVIDDALATLAGRNMRLTLRVMAYNSCCEARYPNHTNIGVPDWVAAIPGATTSYPGPKDSPEAWITQVVPNWNDPHYLKGFGDLLAALGRRYDRDERVSVFEFSGYGDFSENHVAYLRDALGAPGPAPQDSVAVLGYYSQWRDQNITADSIRQLVAAHVAAFPHTRLVANPPNPEVMRQLLAPEVSAKLSAPVGIRADCLGVYAPLPVWAESAASYYVQTHDAVVEEIRRRLATALVISEWCQLGDSDARSIYGKALHDVIRDHVSMTSSVNFPDWDSRSVMDPASYALWAQANAAAGYRYSVAARPGSQTVSGPAGARVAAIAVVWTNDGSAAAVEKWTPGYRVVDFSGTVVRTLPSLVDLAALVGENSAPVSTTESVRVDLTGLPPGHYTLRAVVDWHQHKPDATHVVNYPPMALATDGRDATGAYPIATLDIPRDATVSAISP